MKSLDVSTRQLSTRTLIAAAAVATAAVFTPAFSPTSLVPQASALSCAVPPTDIATVRENHPDLVVVTGQVVGVQNGDLTWDNNPENEQLRHLVDVDAVYMGAPVDHKLMISGILHPWTPRFDEGKNYIFTLYPSNIATPIQGRTVYSVSACPTMIRPWSSYSASEQPLPAEVRAQLAADFGEPTNPIGAPEAVRPLKLFGLFPLPAFFTEGILGQLSSASLQ